MNYGSGTGGGGVSAFERVKHEDEAGEYSLARQDQQVRPLAVHRLAGGARLALYGALA